MSIPICTETSHFQNQSSMSSPSLSSPTTESEQTYPRDDQETPPAINTPDQADNTKQGSEDSAMPANDNDKETVMAATRDCSNSNITESIDSRMKEKEEKEEKVHSEDNTNVNVKTALANTIETLREDRIDFNDNVYEHKNSD